MCVRNRIPNSLCRDGALITHLRRAFPGSWKPQAPLGKMFRCAGSHLGRSLISMCRKGILWVEFCFYSLFFKDHQWFLNSDLLSSMACSESWRTDQKLTHGLPIKGEGEKISIFTLKKIRKNEEFLSLCRLFLHVWSYLSVLTEKRQMYHLFQFIVEVTHTAMITT